MIVAVIGEAVLFTAVKVGRSPDPDAGKPIDGVLVMVHENVAPPVPLVAV